MVDCRSGKISLACNQEPCVTDARSRCIFQSLLSEHALTANTMSLFLV